MAGVVQRTLELGMTNRRSPPRWRDIFLIVSTRLGSFWLRRRPIRSPGWSGMPERAAPRSPCLQRAGEGLHGGAGVHAGPAT